ncbi:MAG: hypothetical protein KC649_01640, partial [Candidatus Omnitrophica bacterium]|nr:hypothetical protein [Candidatus Omnitrophota bacterium]
GARLSGEIPSGIRWEADEYGQADYREEAKLLLDDDPESAEIVVRNLEDALIQLNLTAGLTSFHHLGDAVNALVDAAQTAAEDTDLLRADLTSLAGNPSELIRRLQEAVEQGGVQNAGFLSDTAVTGSEDFRAALMRYFVALLFTLNAADNSVVLRPDDRRELLMEYLDAALIEGEREADETDFELIDLEDPSESLEGVASTVQEFSSGGALSLIRREVNYQLGLFINLTGEFGDTLADALDRYEAAYDTDVQSGEVSIQGFIRSLDSDPETLQRLNNAYSEIRSRWMSVRYSDFLNQTLFNPDSGKAARSARRFFGNADRDYISKQIGKFLKDVGITSPVPYLHEVETAIASENVLTMAQRFNRAVLNDSRDYFARQNISPVSGHEQMGLANRYITENENSIGFLRAVFRAAGSRMASDTDRKTPKQIQIILEQTKKFEQLFTDSNGELKPAYLDERFDFEKVIPASERSKIQQAFRSLAAYEAPFKDEVDRILKITDAEDRLRAIQTLERTYLPVDTEIATAAQIKSLNGLTPKMATALFQLYFSSGLDRGIVHAKIFYEQVLTPMDQHLNPEILENYLRLLNLIGQFKPDLINDNAYDTLFEAADRAESVIIERNYLKGTKKRILSGIQIARATAFKNRYRAAYDFAREMEVEDELSDPVKLASLYFRFYKAYSKAELKKIFGDKVFEALPAPVQNPSLQQARRINSQIGVAITQSSERIGDPTLSLKDAIKAIKAASSTDASVSQVFYRLAYGDEADPYPLGESYALTNVMRSLIYNGEFRKARQIAPVVVRVSVETDYFNDFWSAAAVAEAEIIGRNGKGYQQRAMAALEQAIKLSASSRTELQSYLDLMEHLAVQLEDHYEERWEQTDTVELTDEDLAYQFLTQTFLPRLRAAADESAAPEPSEESSLGERLVRTSYKISGSSKFIRPMNLRFGGTVPGAYVGPSDYGLLSDFLTTPAEGLGGKALIEIDDFEEVNELINGFIKSNFNLKNFELIESDQHLLYDAPTIQSVSFMGSDLSKRGATSVVTQTFAGIGDCRYCNFFGQFALMSYVKIKRHQADAKLVRSILGESLNREQYEAKKQEWLQNDFHHLEVSVVDTYLSAAVQKDGPYSAAKVLANGTAVTDIETQKDFYFIPGEEQKIEPHTLLHVIQRDKEKAIQAFEDGADPLDVFDVIENAYLNDFFYQRVYPLRGYRFIENGEVVGGIRTDDGTSGNLKLNDDGSIDLRIPNALRLLQDPASGAESRTDLHVQIIARSRSEGNRTNLPTTYDLLGTQGFYHHRSVNFPASTAKLLLSHVGNIDTPERQLQKKEHVRTQAALRYLVEAADSGPNELVQLQTSNIILGDNGSRLSSESVEELAGTLFEQVSALYPGKESYFLNSHFRKAQERAGQYLPEYYDAVLEEAGILAGDPSNQNTAKRFVFLDAGATPLLKPFQTYANVKYGIPEDRSVNLWATMGQMDAIWDKKNQIVNLDLAAALLKYFDDSGVFGTPENDAEELVFVDTDSRWGKKVDSSPAGLGTEVLIYKLLFDEAVIRQAEKNYPKKDGYPGIHIPKAIKDQSNPKVKVVYISLNNVEQTDLNEELSEFYGIDPESYQRLNVIGVQGAEKLKDIDTMFIDMSP